MDNKLANQMLGFCEGADEAIRKEIGELFRKLNEKQISAVVAEFTSWEALILDYSQRIYPPDSLLTHVFFHMASRKRPPAFFKINAKSQ